MLTYLFGFRTLLDDYQSVHRRSEILLGDCGSKSYSGRRSFVDAPSHGT